jgi:hypothetical protein
VASQQAEEFIHESRFSVANPSCFGETESWRTITPPAVSLLICPSRFARLPTDLPA